MTPFECGIGTMIKQMKNGSISTHNGHIYYGIYIYSGQYITILKILCNLYMICILQHVQEIYLTSYPIAQLLILQWYSVHYIEISKKVTHSASKESFTGTFLRDCVLGHFRECRSTIQAGRSVARPKAPPCGSFVESIATDQQTGRNFILVSSVEMNSRPLQF